MIETQPLSDIPRNHQIGKNGKMNMIINGDY